MTASSLSMSALLLSVADQCMKNGSPTAALRPLCLFFNLAFKFLQDVFTYTVIVYIYTTKSSG